MLNLKENETCPQGSSCSFSGQGTDCPCMGMDKNRNSKFSCDLIDIEPPKQQFCSFRPKQPSLNPIQIAA